MRIAVRCFFFQAEDGIRDAQESRGLGDVYKRQALAIWPQASGSLCADSPRRRLHDDAGKQAIERDDSARPFVRRAAQRADARVDLLSRELPRGVVGPGAVFQGDGPVSYTHLTLPTIYSV